MFSNNLNRWPWMMFRSSATLYLSLSCIFSLQPSIGNRINELRQYWSLNSANRASLWWHRAHVTWIKNDPRTFLNGLNKTTFEDRVNTEIQGKSLKVPIIYLHSIKTRLFLQHIYLKFCAHILAVFFQIYYNFWTLKIWPFLTWPWPELGQRPGWMTS